jgi:glutaconate CoA-transferase subunit B
VTYNSDGGGDLTSQHLGFQRAFFDHYYPASAVEPIQPPADFTERELMVIAAAREIRDQDVVFVGMRLPLIAFAYAKRTHAPGATGLFENGVVRDQPAPETLMTMSDTPNIPGALWCTGTLEIMAFLQQGLVDLGFIGGAEIDRFGNLNTSYIGDWRRPKLRLPGSGGGADIASLARRFVVIMPQEKHRFRERVDYITSPGFGDGPGWRARVGLTGGGPAAVVTTLGVFRFDPATCEMYLASYHPGQSVDSVRAATGFALRTAPDVEPTPTPTAAELAIVRECDPAGFWTRGA